MDYVMLVLTYFFYWCIFSTPSYWYLQN